MANSRYQLDAALDYARRFLQVEETIHYVNRTGESLQDLRLMVEPAFYPGVFHLIELAWGDGQAVEGFAWEGTQLLVPLPQALAPGGTIDIKLVFELQLPSPVPSPTTRPVPFGYTARQVNLVDWYPFIPPYIPGQGWLAHPQGYFGEHLGYEVADFEVNFRLAEPTYGGQPLTVAASAAAGQDDAGYHYRLEGARNFAISVSHEFIVTTQQVGPVTVLGYAFPAHSIAGERVTQTTAEALALYSELFGPYPHDTLSVVEADFLDGMEYDGLYFLSNGFYNLYQGTPGEYLVAIAAHETAHQWWYALIGNDQALQPWLDEALCTYSERLFFERLYPDALDWWWNYRVNYYEPQGFVDGTIYSFAETASPYRSYRDAVYLNGAVFLEDLRHEIGDEAFFAFLKAYAAQFAGQIATTQDFFQLLQQHSPVDLSALLSRYFQQP